MGVFLKCVINLLCVCWRSKVGPGSVLHIRRNFKSRKHLLIELRNMRTVLRCMGWHAGNETLQFFRVALGKAAETQALVDISTANPLSLSSEIQLHLLAELWSSFPHLMPWYLSLGKVLTSTFSSAFRQFLQLHCNSINTSNKTTWGHAYNAQGTV